MKSAGCTSQDGVNWHQQSVQSRLRFEKLQTKFWHINKLYLNIIIKYKKTIEINFENKCSVNHASDVALMVGTSLQCFFWDMPSCAPLIFTIPASHSCLILVKNKNWYTELYFYISYIVFCDWMIDVLQWKNLPENHMVRHF